MKLYWAVPIKRKTKIYISIIAVTFLVLKTVDYTRQYKAGEEIHEIEGKLFMLDWPKWYAPQKVKDLVKKDEVIILSINKLNQKENIHKHIHLSAIKDIPSLDSLSILGAPNTIDFHKLTSNSKATILNATNVKQHKENSVLNISNSAVKYLGLSKVAIDYIYFSEGLNIEFLYLNNVKVKAIAGIEKLRKLKELDISHLGIRDISFLRNLKDLEYLDLQGQYVQDFSVLSELKKLKKLSLSTDGDISFHKELKKLEKLNVWYNSQTVKLEDYSKEYEKRKKLAQQLIEIQKALPDCRIISDHYSNEWDIR